MLSSGRHVGLCVGGVCLSIVLLLSSAWCAVATEHTVQVHTQYSGSASTLSSKPKTWTIRKESREGSLAIGWLFYVHGLDEPFCRVHISNDDGATKIVISDRKRGPLKESDNGLLVLPGYPAPCNFLPVDQADFQKVYEEKRSAGGRVFVTRYRVFLEKVDIYDAFNKGWLPKGKIPNKKPAAAIPQDSMASEQGELTMLTVMDDKGAAVVKQLWRKGDIWWLYEETPFKRSWRVK